MTTITTLTRDAAAAEDLTETQYREIYDEIRGKTNLRDFQYFIHSARSFAWWSKYERGEVRLSRADRNDLRRAWGLPALPMSVEEAITGIHPDAVVYRVGDQVAEMVAIIADPGPLTIHINGGLRVVPEVSDDPPPGTPVTSVTAALAGVVGQGDPQIGQRKAARCRPPTVVLRAPLAYGARLDARRQAGETRTACLLRLLDEVLS